MSALWDCLRVWPQYLLPHHALSRLAFHLTRCEYPPLKNLLIRIFIAAFRVDMTLAVRPDARDYRHFNDFFTRALMPGARPIGGDANTIICPVDGRVSQIGNIEGGEIFQAKNRKYALDDLLARERDATEAFTDGNFATLYLSPRDYHRVHMPVEGRLVRMIHVPGRLFAVNTHTTRVIDKLFARNERVISLFDTALGPMALILVGALNVGSMETVWAGTVTPARRREITTVDYRGQDIVLQRGQEMGRFNMGSTVILLFTKDSVVWSAQMLADRAVAMGETLATRYFKP